MTDTAPPAAGGPEPQSQRPPRLTRSSDERMIAGVCGGLAAYTGIDPIVFRIGFGVSALLGGAGLLAYVLAWILVPDEDGARERDMHVTTVALVVLAAVVGFPFVVASLFHGGSGGLLVGLGLVFLFATPWGRDIRHDLRRDLRWRRGARRAGLYGREPWPPPWGAGPGAWSGTATTGSMPAPPVAPVDAPTAPSGIAPDAVPGSGPPPIWPPAPPLLSPPPLPPAPRHAKRTRSRLGRLTLSAAVLVGGVLALIETSEVADLAAPTVLALLLLVVAAGLITGAWYGRAHGLIAIGVLLAFAAVSSTAADVHLRGGVGDREWHPSASTLRDRYSLGVGDAHLDLAAIAPLGGTRRVRAKVGIGQLVVDLPADVDVDVRASTGIGNVDAAGFPRPNSRRDDDVDVVYDSPGTDRLILVLDVGIGHIEVRRAGAFGGVLRLTPIAPVPPIAPTPARAPEVQP